MQSLPFTTEVSSNPAHGEVYSIQHYVIKFVSDLRHVCGFLRVLWFPPPIKLTHNITEIVFNITLTLNVKVACRSLKLIVFFTHSYILYCICIFSISMYCIQENKVIQITNIFTSDVVDLVFHSSSGRGRSCVSFQFRSWQIVCSIPVQVKQLKSNWYLLLHHYTCSIKDLLCKMSDFLLLRFSLT